MYDQFSAAFAANVGGYKTNKWFLYLTSSLFLFGCACDENDWEDSSEFGYTEQAIETDNCV